MSPCGVGRTLWLGPLLQNSILLASVAGFLLLLNRLPLVLMEGVSGWWILAPIAGMGMGYALALWIQKDPDSREFWLRTTVVSGFWCGLLILYLSLVVRENLLREERELREQAVAEAVAELEREREAAALKQLSEAADVLERTRFIRHLHRIPVEELLAIHEIDSRIVAEMEKEVGEYRELMESSSLEGPQGWIESREAAELEIQRTAHDRLYAKTRKLLQLTETFEERYLENLLELELSEQGRRVAIAEMERLTQTWVDEDLLRLRRLDVRLLGTALEGLNILIHEWGAWSYSPGDESLQFESDSAQGEFGRILLDLKGITAELDELD